MKRPLILVAATLAAVTGVASRRSAACSPVSR
jgi:hypothetical protein